MTRPLLVLFVLLLGLSAVAAPAGPSGSAEPTAPAKPAAPAKPTASDKTVGNPVLPGWYADPEARVFGDQYWIFATYSAPYDEQTFMDCFSSPDLATWTKHPRVIDTNVVKWARRAIWAPSIVEKGGKYYLFFGANDIQNDKEVGGIGVAVADHPDGPYRDYLGKPLVNRFHNGAQPIDQFVFKDKDGRHYLIYGGWRHCNIAGLNDDFTGFVPFEGGQVFREITPEQYVEGPFMFLRDGKYYLMWSEGGWTGSSYAVAYAMGDSPVGPFKRIGKVLVQDPAIATGAGHHSVLKVPGTGTTSGGTSSTTAGRRERRAPTTGWCASSGWSSTSGG